MLRTGGHELVLSPATVGELAAPLQQRAASTNVMALLNSLEELPLIYSIDEDLHRLELEFAMSAWRAAREPQPVASFRDRLDRALSPAAPPPTDHLVAFSLSQIVDMLWREGSSALWAYQAWVPLIRASIVTSRLVVARPSPVKHLESTIRKDLKLHQVPFEEGEVLPFATWLGRDWRRAPSYRLSLEVYRQLVFNTSDQLQDGDLVDMLHVYSLPYVDLMTLDHRMIDYTRRASKAIGADLHDRIAPSLPEALRLRVGTV